jgi:hypothetical protein
MSLDSLENSVTEYRARKSELVKEQLAFYAEQNKADMLSAFSSHLDDTIVSAVLDIQNEFSIEKEDLDQRTDQMQRERDTLTMKILDEQSKLDRVQQRIAGLSGKKYTNGLDAVSQKCDLLLAELDEMLKELDSTSETAGLAVSDTPGNDRAENGSGTSRTPKSGFWSTLFSKNQAVPSGPKFGNFDLAPAKNRTDFFVKGAHFDQFINDYYHSEKSTYESLGNNGIIKTISPGNIEGIHLGCTEVSDSTIFWSQHERGGTKDSFVKIASHIPEVNHLLKSGMTLEDIRAYPSLERCVNIYFEPSNIPRVIQSNGYYEFESNGRHRILAAREAGYDIPVQIVGIRRWK